MMALGLFGCGPREAGKRSRIYSVAIKRQALVRSGLALLDGPSCPLCDMEWNAEKLRAHLEAKLAGLRGGGVEGRLRRAGRVLAARRRTTSHAP